MQHDTPPDGATAVAEIDRLVAERVARGECGCGCHGPIPVPAEGREPRTKYVGQHRQRVYRKRVQQRAVALGVEPRVSLSRLRAPSPTRARIGDAQKHVNGDETGMLTDPVMAFLRAAGALRRRRCWIYPRERRSA